MTFGQAIRLVLNIFDIKMGVLAGALDYDISYLSKWVNDAKLPSQKSAESLCDRIAAYAKSVSTPGMQTEAAVKLSFQPCESTSFEKALSDRLYTIYLEQKTQKSQDDNEYNSAASHEWGLNPNSASDELFNYYSGLSSDCVGLLALPTELLNSDFLLRLNERCQTANEHKILRLMQLVSADDFDGNVDKYIKYLLMHLSMLSPVQVEYYSPFDNVTKPSDSPLFILKNHIAVSNLKTPPGATGSFSVFTRSPNLISEIYNSCINCFHPVLLQVERLDIYDELPYSYAASQNSRVIMPYMGNLRLGGALLDEFLDKYLDAPHMYEYHRKMHILTSGAPYSLILYVSALIEYINTGRIHLFDGVVTVEKEDRKKHLQFLLDEIEEDKGVSVKILNDKNPILNRHDNILTIYTNENASFAASDAPNLRSELFNFVSPVIKRQVNTFFDHIEAMPESYIRQGKTAVDFIHGMIKLI